jgi:hypothetical protein
VQRIAIILLSLFVTASMIETTSAKVVKISGTHSKSEIKSTCAANGGSYGSASNGEYWCNKDGGGSVACKKGKCTASVPLTVTPDKTGTVADPSLILAQ